MIGGCLLGVNQFYNRILGYLNLTIQRFEIHLTFDIAATNNIY